MKLVQSILTKNPCYTAGRKITVKGLMLHSVGCPQPRASVFINNWNSPSYNNACVHGFIDGNDGTVYQTLPWNHRGWHAGGAEPCRTGDGYLEAKCYRKDSGSNSGRGKCNQFGDGDYTYQRSTHSQQPWRSISCGIFDVGIDADFTLRNQWNFVQTSGRRCTACFGQTNRGLHQYDGRGMSVINENSVYLRDTLYVDCDCSCRNAVGESKWDCKFMNG